MFVFNWGVRVVRVLALQVLLLLSGCILDSPDGGGMRREQRREAGDDSWRWDGEPAHWGQTRTFDSNAGVSAQQKVTWVAGEKHLVLDLPGPVVWRTPQVQSLVLSAMITSTGVVSFYPRWVIEVGVGGGRTIFTIDAQQLQQVTLPAVTVRASLILDRTGTGAFAAALVKAQCSAFIADGNSGTNEAQYTTDFFVAVGSSQRFAIPPGASALRLLNRPNLHTFDADVSYELQQSTTTLDGYIGTDFAVLHKAEGFVPIPAAADGLLITTVANQAFGGLLYQMEL